MAFKELATRRFSVRKYTNEPVSKEDIEYIMDCVRLAPSACNRQPWKFLLLTSDNAKEKIRQCYNRDWFKSAPVYVLCFKDVNGCWVRPEDATSALPWSIFVSLPLTADSAPAGYVIMMSKP